VYIGNQIAGIALAVGKDNLCLRVIQQQPDELATSITGGT